MKLGLIGSGSIVDLFIESCRLVDDVSIELTYSRSIEKAKAFSEKHQIPHYCDNLETLFSSDLIDTVYIASPNSLHYPQSYQALMHGKNVICEKPCCAYTQQYQQLMDIAKEKNCYIIEAITNAYVPTLSWLKENLSQCGHISCVTGTFCQYSSRFDKYQNHEVTNVFDPQMQGGGLMDIGIYLLHITTLLFGMPTNLQAKTNIGFNGIDTSGILLLQYPTFTANLTYSKDCSCPHLYSICGYDKSLIIDESSVGRISHVALLDHNNKIIDEDRVVMPNMYYELSAICRMFDHHLSDDIYKANQHTLDVLSLMEKARQQIGLNFEDTRL